jgi:hypothetical protein
MHAAIGTVLGGSAPGSCATTVFALCDDSSEHAFVVGDIGRYAPYALDARPCNQNGRYVMNAAYSP